MLSRTADLPRHIPLTLLRRNLLWKQLREQWPVAPLLLALQAIHTAEGRAAELPRELMIGLWTGSAIFAALVYGSLFFAAESRREGRGFLLQQPISHLSVLRSKLAAGGLQIGGLLVLSAVFFAALTGLGAPFPTSGPGWLALFSALALALVSGAYASIWIHQAIVALLAAVVFFCLSAAAVLEVAGLTATEAASWLGPTPAGPADRKLFFAFTVSAAAITGIGGALYYQLSRLELDGGAMTTGHLLGARLSRAFRRLRAAVDGGGTRGFLRPLFGGEWRQKGRLATVLLTIPGLALALHGWNAGLSALFPLRGFELWAAFAGASLGIVLFTSPERAVDFVLYHLPVHRELLVAQRLLPGLVFGALLVAELGLVAGRMAAPHPAFLLRFAVAFCLCFGLGAMLSPWPAHPTSGVFLVLATALGLEISIAAAPDLLGWSRPLTWVLVLTAVWTTALWSTAKNSAVEPWPIGRLWAIGLLLASWSWVGWTLFSS